MVFIPYENINLDIFLNKILEKPEDDIFEEFQQWNDSIYSMIDSAVYKLDNYDDCNDVNDYINNIYLIQLIISSIHDFIASIVPPLHINKYK